MQEEQKSYVIGTLGEKTLHSFLKHYFEKHPENHEVKIGRYVADIVGEDGIIEIQTGNFERLIKKLDAFLSVANVTIVYPIIQTKWLVWLGKQTGELSNRRKSSKKGTVYDAFFQLYKIKKFLTHDGLRFCFVLLEAEEIRYLNGWDKSKKRGSERCDRIPIGILDEIYIKKLWDYKKLIPQSIPEKFTSKDYQKHTGLRLRDAETSLNVLHYIKAIERIGKCGALYLYQKSEEMG